MTMTEQFKIIGQYLLPKHLISRLVGMLAAMRGGSFTHALIRAFIRQYQVDMSEAQKEQPQEYDSFNDFFTRALKPGLRPICEGAQTLALPVDGCVSQLGNICEGRIIQAKGHDYSLRALLGDNKLLADQFQGGDFATIYLSPRDYHRIHMPCDGTLISMIYVPGSLFSVNQLTAEYVPDLFARNERVICLFDTEFGPMAMILVGATIVASIETVWAGTVTRPTGKRIQRWDYSESTSPKLCKGDEMGRFKLGSTVICLFAKDRVTFDSVLEVGCPTRLGQPFASVFSVDETEDDPVV